MHEKNRFFRGKTAFIFVVKIKNQKKLKKLLPENLFSLYSAFLSLLENTLLSVFSEEKGAAAKRVKDCGGAAE